jgi:tetratricopeptide (TPR) repeat protein
MTDRDQLFNHDKDLPEQEYLSSNGEESIFIQWVQSVRAISAPASLLPNVLSRLDLPDGQEQEAHMVADLALAYRTIADNYMSLGRYEDALAAYDRGIQFDANSALTHMGKGKALYQLERYRDAVQAYEQAICLDASCALVYAGQGAVFEELKSYKEVLHMYQQALQLKLNHSSTSTQHQEVLGKLKDLQNSAEEKLVLLAQEGDLDAFLRFKEELSTLYHHLRDEKSPSNAVKE